VPSPGRVAQRFADSGYLLDSEAAELLADAGDDAVEAILDATDEEALRVSAEEVRTALETSVSFGDGNTSNQDNRYGRRDEMKGVSDASRRSGSGAASDETATGIDETGAAATGDDGGGAAPGLDRTGPSGPEDGGVAAAGGRSPVEPDVSGDITGHSTGTGEYADYVSLFRDRYQRLSGQLRGRVNYRPTNAIDTMSGGSDAATIGMVSDVRSTANGHWLVELEDTNGTFPCLVVKDKELAGVVDELLLDEVIAVEGTLADDGGILFADSIHFPDVPRTYSPSTADRHVQAALISDVHVGSQEFMADAWEAFADWLHTDEAAPVEYLLLAGDMVEGVGVYPDQDEELDIVDIFEQYEAFAERLKAVPGDIEVVMIPGNHDAVRLAEPQPAFDEELRDVMSAHDARIVGNPSTVTIEGVSVLMYHGVSLDEVIAEIPDASYDAPHEAMYHLLRKRHLAPQFGNHVRMAPETEDYLVLDEVPDVFHAGHVHKLGVGRYHNVTVVNSGCWQAQTAFQRANNIDPDSGVAPILDLDTLDVTLRKFT
jgi:DNA polymerase II small subunit